MKLREKNGEFCACSRDRDDFVDNSRQSSSNFLTDCAERRTENFLMLIGNSNQIDDRC